MYTQASIQPLHCACYLCMVMYLRYWETCDTHKSGVLLNCCNSSLRNLVRWFYVKAKRILVMLGTVFSLWFLKSWPVCLGLLCPLSQCLSPPPVGACTPCVVVCVCVYVSGGKVCELCILDTSWQGTKPPHSLGGHKDLPTHCLVQSPLLTSLCIVLLRYSCSCMAPKIIVGGAKAFPTHRMVQRPLLSTSYNGLSTLCVAHSK